MMGRPRSRPVRHRGAAIQAPAKRWPRQSEPRPGRRSQVLGPQLAVYRRMLQGPLRGAWLQARLHVAAAALGHLTFPQRFHRALRARPCRPDRRALARPRLRAITRSGAVAVGSTRHVTVATFVGREQELASLEGFLERFPHGLSAVVIEGQAGIGKTTVWLEAVRLAEERDLRVLKARPAESEADLSYAALADLVGAAFDETRSSLPGRPGAGARLGAPARRARRRRRRPAHGHGPRQPCSQRSPNGSRCWSPSTTCSGSIPPPSRR